MKKEFNWGDNFELLCDLNKFGLKKHQRVIITDVTVKKYPILEGRPDKPEIETDMDVMLHVWIKNKMYDIELPFIGPIQENN